MLQIYRRSFKPTIHVYQLVRLTILLCRSQPIREHSRNREPIRGQSVYHVTCCRVLLLLLLLFANITLGSCQAIVLNFSISAVQDTAVFRWRNTDKEMCRIYIIQPFPEGLIRPTSYHSWSALAFHGLSDPIEIIKEQRGYRQSNPDTAATCSWYHCREWGGGACCCQCACHCVLQYI